jgi:hypothetical protein
MATQKSIAAEELKRRREFFNAVRRMQARPSITTQPQPTTEEMQREDRAR